MSQIVRALIDCILDQHFIEEEIFCVILLETRYFLKTSPKYPDPTVYAAFNRLFSSFISKSCSFLASENKLPPILII